jgi:hypothetical protein
MGSVSSPSSGISTLLQMLSAESPQLASMLSATKIQSALKASPTDLVKLSDEALQLQQVDMLFGGSDGTQSTGLPSVSDSLFPTLSYGGSVAESDPILGALGSSLAQASGAATASMASTGTVATEPPPSTSSASTLADQVTNARVQQMAALFGTPTVDSLIDTLG